MKYFILILFLLPNLACANYNVKGAKIIRVSLSNDFAPGTVFVKTEGGTVLGPKNECAITSWSFTHKVKDDEISKSQFSMILAAKASGAKINFTGSGDCRVGYGVETLYTIDLED